MTVYQLAVKLEKLRDKGFGDSEIFISDDQGGSYESGSVKICKEKHYAEWGALAEYYEDENNTDPIVVINCSN